MKLTRTFKIIIIVFFLLLVGLGIYYFLCNREPRNGIIDASPYSCAWNLEENSLMRIELSGELPEAGRWSIMANSNVIELSQLPDSPVFTVKACNSGIGILTLTVRDIAEPVETGADFKLYFTVDEKNNISLDSFSADLLKPDRFASGNGDTLYWKKGETGSLFLYLTGTDWRIRSADGVLCSAPTVDGDIVRMEVIANPDATPESLVLINNQTDEGFELHFTMTDEVLELEKCEAAKAAEPEPPEPDPDKAALQELLKNAETAEEKDRLIAQYWREQQDKLLKANAANADTGADTADTDDNNSH